jgi:predicted transcriptional regulator
MLLINHECRCCGTVIKILPAEECKRLRTYCEMSLRQVSNHTKLSISYLHDIENGRRNCPLVLVRFWQRAIRTNP